MKIEDRRRPPSVKFLSLDAGSIFFGRGTYYMKIYWGAEVRAVRLTTGEVCSFDQAAMVQHIPSSSVTLRFD